VLPDVLPYGWLWPAIQVDSPHIVNFTSFALSLLLVFRTNSRRVTGSRVTGRRAG
jgi:hypothetical protein